MTFTTRFAPSPTGLLHRGHAYSALTAYQAAREAGGRFLLRIEDIDQGRCRREFEDAIYDDLAWLGLAWETPVRRQSQHFDDYRRALDRLRERGLVYRCFKTRREILDEIGRAPHGPGEGPDGVLYRGGPLPPDEEAALIEQGKPFAWRLSLDRAREELGARFDRLAFIEEGTGMHRETGVVRVRPESAGDVVLARKDAGVAYHLAVVVDDALQGVTHVIRGADLQEAVHVQRLLQTLLDLPEPVYRHHPLLTDAEGKRFAKRDRAETLADLRARGVGAQALRSELGFD
ncbi:MAG TPA: tRNA glutamyl-Q(34) synthetase GluQRS [Caulobacteraceae bacterium]|jgi:glutamyl-Q tRNA(Asp) synthetase|nr:tRNA glutamyl-Q(34) synthetase GluQRS [Caulobacteraceae bacterium]